MPDKVFINVFCTSRRELYLLLEFCPFGNMKSFLVENRFKFVAALANTPGTNQIGTPSMEYTPVRVRYSG